MAHDPSNRNPEQPRILDRGAGGLDRVSWDYLRVRFSKTEKTKMNGLCAQFGCRTVATSMHANEYVCDAHYLEREQKRLAQQKSNLNHCPKSCRNEDHNHPRAEPVAPLSGHDDITHDRFGYQQGCSVCNPRCAVLKCRKPSTTIFDRVPFCDEHTPRDKIADPRFNAILRDYMPREETQPAKQSPHNAWFLTRFNLIQYLKDKVEQNDWHAVSDAANDLRVLEAQEPK